MAAQKMMIPKIASKITVFIVFAFGLVG